MDFAALVRIGEQAADVDDDTAAKIENVAGRLVGMAFGRAMQRVPAPLSEPTCSLAELFLDELHGAIRSIPKPAPAPVAAPEPAPLSADKPAEG